MADEQGPADGRTNDGERATAVSAGNPPRGAAGGGTKAMAAVALVAALTSAFWAPPLFQFMHLKTPTASKLARQDVEIGRLNQTVADLERKVVDLTAAVGRAEQEAAAAKAGRSTAESRTGQLALAQLQSALRRPGPFDIELALVRATNPDIGDLAPLIASVERFASTGILVGAQLRQEFRNVADEVRRHDFKVIPVAWFNSLIGRQPQGETAAMVPPMERASAAIDRAQDELGSGNLAGAVTELSQLTGEAGSMVSAWVGDAKARLAADTLVDRLGDRVAAGLSATPVRK